MKIKFAARRKGIKNEPAQEEAIFSPLTIASGTSGTNGTTVETAVAVACSLPLS